MYPIKIEREPKEVLYTKSVDLDNDVLTLAELRKYVTENESFSIIEKENSIYASNYVLSISGKRLETTEETMLRVEKEEKYMAEYNKRKSNNPAL